MENMKVMDEETISIFVPMEIRRRGGAAMIILPKNVDTDIVVSEHNYDERMMSAFAKAYKWHMMLKSEKAQSLSEICKKEKVSSSYASRIYRLNVVAPKIIEAVMNGTQPRTLCLQDFLAKTIPDLWEEQMELYGFK